MCHGCYDAPCQLLLSSHEGFERGGSKKAVYDSDRLTAAKPTRLFLDAATAEGDLSVVDPGFLERTREYLDLPAEHGSHLAPGALWLEYAVSQRRFLEAREERYDAIDPDRRGPTLDWIWDGDGHNRNALLTVFRHFDNATVVKGFVGEIPETAWVLDYPLFERIYYDLVAGFDVFGNLTHQVSTRLYMDHLRMQSENTFLAFLPQDLRQAIRDSWYAGATRNFTYAHIDKLRALHHGTSISFETDDPKAELLEMIAARDPQVSGPPDRLNRCAKPPCDRPDASPAERKVERILQGLTGVRGPWVAPLPELIFLRVRSPELERGAVVYALAHTRAHTNVASMSDEDDRLEPEKDTLVAVRGTLGSYPNFAFDVELDELEELSGSLRAVTLPVDLDPIAARWGVRRTSPRFWEIFDWIHEDFRRRAPAEAGIFDLARYGNL